MLVDLHILSRITAPQNLEALSPLLPLDSFSSFKNLIVPWLYYFILAYVLHLFSKLIEE